jgi:hypothetical protein
MFPQWKMIPSTSSSLVNQLVIIHLILAKQGKLVSNSLTNQLRKNRKSTKFSSPRAYIRAATPLPSAAQSQVGGREKK